MNFIQHLKNKKSAIENYLTTPNDPVVAYRLFKKRDHHSYFHEKNRYVYSKLIRKDLQLTKDKLYKQSPSQTASLPGLYHNRNDDYYDYHHMDCVEDGFCMCHNRAYEPHANYKHHYHCRYSQCTHWYQDDGMFHGERKWFSNKFVCFGCRKMISRSTKERNIRTNEVLRVWPKCAGCQQHMTGVSVAFQPPPKHDVKHWKKLDKEWYDDARITYEEYKKQYGIQ